MWGVGFIKIQNYKLTFLPTFEEDLNEIVDYISISLNNPPAAYKLVDDLESAILKRAKAPLMLSPYQSLKERKHSYYRINVRNFSIFYIVYDNTIEVRRVIYSKRDVAKLLK